MANDVIPPMISAQLNYLLSHSPFSIRVERMWSGSKNWDILYNVQNPLSAPDVIFGAEDENFNSYILSDVGLAVDSTKSPLYTLSNWNSRDPTRLLCLIHQLREMYLAYQRKRVAEVDDERVKFEISTILSREGLEMCLSSAAEKPQEVKFAVPLLDLNINAMIPACPWKHQQKIFLQVIYPIRKYHSTPPAPRLELVSTPDLKSLFAVEDVKLPSWLEGMCLAEYLPAVEETLQKQILEAVSLIGIRRHFIESLPAAFGRPLEADAIFCRKATVLVANGAFTFLVHISIPAQFPKEQPTLILQSSQHFSQGVPIQSPVLSEYPWSPRWEPSEMASRIFDFLVEESSNFKKICNDAIQQR